MKPRVFIILIGVVFFFGVLVRLLTPPSVVNDEKFDLGGEKKKLLKLFQEKGGKEAYRYFTQNYQSVDPVKIHDLAHYVGRELYNKEGIPGVLLCDDSYNYGCYHGFFGQAMLKEGESFLIKAEPFCKGKGKTGVDFGGCVHGMGHGILAMKGYTRENVIWALERCDGLSPVGAKGCYNGVFMEYNARSMQAVPQGSAPAFRQFQSDRPYEPCDDLPLPYQYDCYYEQPNWWTMVFYGQYDRMGILCSQIANRKNYESCFRGIGRIIPLFVSYDVDAFGKACDTMPTQQGKAFCIEDGIQVLLAQNKDEALALCTRLEGELQKSCTVHMNGYLCSVLSRCQKK